MSPSQKYKPMIPQAYASRPATQAAARNGNGGANDPLARFYERFGAPLPALLRDGKAAAKGGSYAAGPSPRRIAFVTGGARAMRQTAEALEALERGETPKELSPNIVIDPTREKIEAACREIGVDPPSWPLPEGGWSGPIMASAAQPIARQGFIPIPWRKMRSSALSQRDCSRKFRPKSLSPRMHSRTRNAGSFTRRRLACARRGRLLLPAP
jgi:hypothetical protein